MDSTSVTQLATQSWLTTLLPVFTSVIVALATLFGVWLTNRSSHNRLELQLLHERSRHAADKNASRLEELYVMVGRDAHSITMFYAHYLPAASGMISLTAARQKSMEYGFKDAPDQERLEMMFHLHYPELVPDFQLFKGVVQDVWSKWEACEKVLESGQLPSLEQKKSFQASWLLIEAQAKQLKKKVAAFATIERPQKSASETT